MNQLSNVIDLAGYRRAGNGDSRDGASAPGHAMRSSAVGGVTKSEDGLFARGAHGETREAQPLCDSLWQAEGT